MQAAALCGLAASAKPGWRADGISSVGGKTAGTRGLTPFVDVFIGTGGHGHTFPGATVPFWMVQLSPNTWTGGWDHCSGYHHDDASIMGFSHTHLSATTWDGNPYTKSWFSHAQIAQGGKIVLRMGAQRNEQFGAAVEDRPPSRVRRGGPDIPDLWHPEATTRNGH